MKPQFIIIIVFMMMVGVVPLKAQEQPAKNPPVIKTQTPSVPGNPPPAVPPAAKAGEGTAKTDPATKAPDVKQPVATDANQPAVDEDPLKGITIHERPTDFAGAQQLARQNREDRIALMQSAIRCIQQAANMDELTECLKDERKDMDKVWLSYCDTNIGPLNSKSNIPKKDRNRKNRNLQQAAPSADASQPADSPPEKIKATECERALSAVTGKPIPKKINPNNNDLQEPAAQ